MLDRIFGRIKRFLANEDGPTTVEYAVMLMLILMAVIGSVQLFANALGDSFTDSQDKLQEAFDNAGL